MVLIFILVFLPIIIGVPYRSSVRFYNDFELYKVQIYNRNLTAEQEYIILGTVMNYNHKLQMYQKNLQKWHLFSPVYLKLYDLEPIQLKNFDMSKYSWDDES